MATCERSPIKPTISPRILARLVLAARHESTGAGSLPPALTTLQRNPRLEGTAPESTAEGGKPLTEKPRQGVKV